MHRPRRSDDHNLSPSLTTRFAELTHPGWAHTVLARRIAAAALAVLAVVMLFRGDPGGRQVGVVVAQRDLRPGQILVPDDVRLEHRPAGSVADARLDDLADAVGHTVAGPTRSGEILSDVRVLGPRLAAAAIGTDDARVVPIRLADAGVADLLREGDRVDVFTVAEGGEQVTVPAPTLLAPEAAVVLVSAAEAGRNAKERVVMLALPAPAAAKVAAASLTNSLTVTFH